MNVNFPELKIDFCDMSYKNIPLLLLLYILLNEILVYLPVAMEAFPDSISDPVRPITFNFT